MYRTIKYIMSFGQFPDVYSDNVPGIRRANVQMNQYQPYGSFVQYPSANHQVMVNQQGINRDLMQGLSPYLGVVTYPTGYRSSIPAIYPNEYTTRQNQQRPPNQRIIPSVNVTVNAQRDRLAYPINSSIPTPFLLGYLGMGRLY